MSLFLAFMPRQIRSQQSEPNHLISHGRSKKLDTDEMANVTMYNNKLNKINNIGQKYNCIFNL